MNKKILVCLFITAAFAFSLWLNLRSAQTWTVCVTHILLWLSVLASLHKFTSTKNDTLQQLKEAAERAERAKNNFLVNISHEVRTPLNGVMGMVDLLLETPLDKNQSLMANTIKDAGKNLLDVMNDLLSFTKIESGDLLLENETFQFTKQIAKLVHNMQGEADRKQIELRLHIDKDVPEYINADFDKISQIITGILSNAVKFTEAGYVELRVDTISKSDDSVKLRVSITDTGIGIAADKQEQMFAAFEQEDSSATRKYGGVGLGLAISSRLLGFIGSRLQLESSVGQGSSFYFELDLPYVSGIDEAVLNLELLKQAVGSDELLSKTAELFVKEAPEIWEKIIQSVEKGDNGELYFKSQAIKSYLIFFTKGELFVLCSELESIGQNKSLPASKAAAEAILKSAMPRFNKLIDECKEI